MKWPNTVDIHLLDRLGNIGVRSPYYGQSRARHVKFFENFRFYILQKIWKQILHFTRACKKVGFYILQITRVCKNQFLQITFYRILQDFTRFNKLHFTGFYKILQDFTRFYKILQIKLYNILHFTRKTQFSFTRVIVTLDRLQV